MGRESRSRKDRICKYCNKKLYGNVDRIMKHTELCERALKIGLQLSDGGVERPGQLVDPRGNKL